MDDGFCERLKQNWANVNWQFLLAQLQQTRGKETAENIKNQLDPSRLIIEVRPTHKTLINNLLGGLRYLVPFRHYPLAPVPVAATLELEFDGQVVHKREIPVGVSCEAVQFVEDGEAYYDEAVSHFRTIDRVAAEGLAMALCLRLGKCLRLEGRDV